MGSRRQSRRAVLPGMLACPDTGKPPSTQPAHQKLVLPKSPMAQNAVQHEQQRNGPPVTQREFGAKGYQCDRSYYLERHAPMLSHNTLPRSEFYH